MPLLSAAAANPGYRGLAKFGWFGRLYTSTRICAVSRSVTGVSLKSAKSNWRKSGPRSEFRPIEPKCCVLTPLTTMQESAKPSPTAGSTVQGTWNAERFRKASGECAPANALPTTSGRGKNSPVPL